MTEMRAKVRDFVVSNFLFGEEGNLSEDASFLEEGIVDSTGVLELVEFLEKEFSISVADEELIPENLDSIMRVEDYLMRKLGRTKDGDRPSFTFHAGA
jgi:acyl carrier protein